MYLTLINPVTIYGEQDSFLKSYVPAPPPPTLESLLYVPAKLIWEYRGQQYTDDGTVQTAEHAKHFEEKKTNRNSRLLQKREKYI